MIIKVAMDADRRLMSLFKTENLILILNLMDGVVVILKKHKLIKITVK